MWVILSVVVIVHEARKTKGRSGYGEAVNSVCPSFVMSLSCHASKSFHGNSLPAKKALAYGVGTATPP